MVCDIVVVNRALAMTIEKGDVLLDVVYIDEGYIDHRATGIVLYSDEKKVIVNWVSGHMPWGLQVKEIEHFDLSRDGELEILLNMKRDYLNDNKEK